MLTLGSLKKALRTNKVKISPHAKIRKAERDIPVYSILYALPRSEATARAMVDKHVKNATRLCVDIVVNKTMYSLIFGDLTKEITLITEYRDRLHISHDDDHYSLGDVFRKAG